MSLTVTPGGASDDALVTLAAFQAYCGDRGFDLAFIDVEQEQAIRRATVWVEAMGRPTGYLATRWPGAKASAAQRRAWPRAGATYTDGTAIPGDEIPPAVQDAVCEVAFFDLSNPGQLNAAVTPSGVIKSESVGNAGVKVEYQDGADMHAARVMVVAAYDLLSGILKPDFRGPQAFIGSVG